MTATQHTPTPPVTVLPGPLHELRLRLDEWRAQQPHVIEGPNRYSYDPRTPEWWHLNTTYEKLAANVITHDEAFTELFTELAYQDDFIPWKRCARRHMLVGAAHGTTWRYGDKPVQLMTETPYWTVASLATGRTVTLPATAIPAVIGTWFGPSPTRQIRDRLDQLRRAALEGTGHQARALELDLTLTPTHPLKPDHYRGARR